MNTSLLKNDRQYVSDCKADNVIYPEGLKLIVVRGGEPFYSRPDRQGGRVTTAITRRLAAAYIVAWRSWAAKWPASYTFSQSRI